MLWPILKLLTKRLRKGQVSLNQLARIVVDLVSLIEEKDREERRKVWLRVPPGCRIAPGV